MNGNRHDMSGAEWDSPPFAKGIFGGLPARLHGSGAWADRASCGMALPLALLTGHEGRPVLEHLAGDLEQAVADLSQRPGMSVTAGAERSVPRLSDRVVDNSDPCPVMDGVPQAFAGVAADCWQAEALLAGLGRDETVIGDRAYDTVAVLELIGEAGATAVLPSRSSRKSPRPLDRAT